MCVCVCLCAVYLYVTVSYSATAKCAIFRVCRHICTIVGLHILEGTLHLPQANISFLNNSQTCTPPSLPFPSPTHYRITLSLYLPLSHLHNRTNTHQVHAFKTKNRKHNDYNLYYGRVRFVFACYESNFTHTVINVWTNA